MSVNPQDDLLTLNQPAMELTENDNQQAHIPLLHNGVNDNNRNQLNIDSLRMSLRSRCFGQIIKIYNYARIALAVFIFLYAMFITIRSFAFDDPLSENRYYHWSHSGYRVMCCTI